LNSASSAPLSAPAPYAELAALEQVSTEAPSTDAPSTDAPPTLLADPPEELASSDQALDQKLNQVPADQPIDQLPNDQRQIDQPKAPKAEVAPSASEAAPVAAEAGAEDKKRVNEVAASETASTISQGSESENPGIGAGSGVGDLVNGPIRDAGELRALPGNPNPIYPARDRLRRKEGVAVILGQITADGRVGRVVLEKSSGSKEMDLESAKAFRSWRFQAGQAGWVRKPFQFRLVGQAKEVPSPLGGVLKRNSDALGK
jgi:TonB family protein